MPEYKQHIIDLFNAGVLTTDSAMWYRQLGYAVVCRAGRVVDIVADICA